MKMELKRLEEEIKSTEETITKLFQIKKDSDAGIEINRIVLKAFKEELKNGTF